MPPSLIPRTIPLTLEPEAWDFEACVDREPRTQTRTYRLRMNGDGRLRVWKIRLRGSGAGYYTVTAPTQETLTRGESCTFTITFRPAKPRRYRARLKILFFWVESQNHVLSIWGDTMLEGVGKICAPPAEDEQAGEGEDDGAGAGGDPGGDQPAGEGGTGTTGGGDTGQGGDGAGSGGDPDDGAEPGDSPGGEGQTPTPPPPVREICVRFWKLGGTPADIDEADLDRWVRTANGIFRDARIRFSRARRPFQEVDDIERTSDPHCLDVFVGGPDLIPGDTTGDARGTPSRSLREKLEKLGAHPDHAGRATLGSQGSRIRLESGGGSDPGNVLAHELGHLLGLGPSPAGNPDQHLDPKTGQPITDEGRLMHPRSGGTGLSDLEKKIAYDLADIVKGSLPRHQGCEKTSQIIPDPERRRREEARVAWTAELKSFPESVTATVRSAEPFGLPEAGGSSLVLELDLDGDGELEWRSEYRYGEDGWRIEGPPPAEASAEALAAPSPLVAIDHPAPAGLPEEPAWGLTVSVPKSHLGRSSGEVLWRLSGKLGAAGEVVLPEQGTGRLDLTPPAFVLALDEDRSGGVRGEAGGTVELSGTAWRSSSFTGGVRLGARLEGRSGRLASSVLEAPLPERWSLSVPLPAWLEGGRHRLWVEGRCAHCGSATSLPVELTVEGARPEQRQKKE